MFIFDFDDTLFDTHAFKSHRWQALGRLGVSEELIQKTYLEARTSADGLFTYSNFRHAQVLAQHGFSEQAVMKALDETTRPATLREFVMKGAEDFLKIMADKKPFVLLSLGDAAMQEIKVRGSGLEAYFDRVFMVDRTKKDVLADIFRYEKKSCWFLNDKVAETLELARQFPLLKPILKVSPNISRKEYENSGLPYFESFTEIQQYIYE